MKRLSDAQLTEIRERCEKATEGHWYAKKLVYGEVASHFEDYVIVVDGQVDEIARTDDLHNDNYKEDADFIANAHQDIPALLSEVERLKADIIELQEQETTSGAEAYQMGEVGNIFRDALRDIDTHIRSTRDPIPYIVETLRQNLPEYNE